MSRLASWVCVWVHKLHFLTQEQSILKVFSLPAPPVVSVHQQWVVLEKENQLKCHAEGFYPPPVLFSWTRDGKEIQPPYTTESHPAPDGYYAATGNLTLYPSREDKNVTFGCKVWHNGTNQEIHFKLNITRESITHYITHRLQTKRLRVILKVVFRGQMYPFLFSELASVRLSALPSHSNSIPLTLSCDVESFYPEDVSVTFLQNGTVLHSPPASEQNAGGTYATRRYYTLSSSQREQGGVVQCVVHQPGVAHPVSSSADLDKLDSKGKSFRTKPDSPDWVTCQIAFIQPEVSPFHSYHCSSRRTSTVD